MTTELIVAGFGGQGVLLFGKFLALSGLKEGKEVVWIPSYGPEMRGGTCNCTVIVSDDPIGSPIIDSPNTVVVMNKPSLTKFGPRVSPNGLLLINSSLIDTSSDRTDIRIETVPANEIALELGNGKAANMVALGAYVALTKVVKFDTILGVIEESFAKKKGLADLNVAAAKRGYDLQV
ncbi:MAG: 2-oxoacid:acceptor oxidoreductase family protein [Candidatus Coatesbacteria bacterium]|nr:2-oxoacid:acceptor oxidoreductase family protein [Candidatus Coatesbacteria bacterium]